jgi:protein-L-isoaspartate O-methyltransferase
MRYRDVFENSYELDPLLLEPFRISEEGVRRLTASGGDLPVEEIRSIFPPQADPYAVDIRLLWDAETRFFAVPGPVLARLTGQHRASASPPAAPLGLEETAPGEAPVFEEVEVIPFFDAEGHYPEEMQVPEVRRLHEFFLNAQTHEIFHQSRDLAVHVGPGFTYGDVAVPVAYRALRRVGAGPEDVFYDLGCGCGAAVLTASLLVGRAVGVDVVPGVIEYARRAAAQMGRDNVEFRVQDLRETDLAEASVIFLASTTFPESLCRLVAEKLRQTRPGTRIISVTRGFEGPGIQLVERQSMVFSWSGVGEGAPFDFYFHRRAG